MLSCSVSTDLCQFFGLFLTFFNYFTQSNFQGFCFLLLFNFQDTILFFVCLPLFVSSFSIISHFLALVKTFLWFFSKSFFELVALLFSNFISISYFRSFVKPFFRSFSIFFRASLCHRFWRLVYSITLPPSCQSLFCIIGSLDNYS